MDRETKLWGASPTQLFASAKGRWAVFGIVVVLVCTLHALYLYGERQAVLATESARLQKHVQIIEFALSRRLQQTADVLRDIGPDLVALRNQSVDRAYMNRRLHTTVAAMYAVRTLMLADSNGHVMASSDEQMLGLNFAEEPKYGVVHANGKYERLRLSQPYEISHGVYAIMASQSVWDEKGVFVGYVVAVIEPGLISSLLETANYDRDMRATLIHANGTVLFWTPDPEGMTGRILGRDPRSLFRQHLDSGKVENVLSGMSVSLGVERVAAYRTAFGELVPPGECVIVSLGRMTHALLAPWRARAVRSYAIIAIVACMALGFMLNLERRCKVAQRLIEEQERLREEAARKIDAERKRLDQVIHAADIGVHEFEVPTGAMRVNERWASMLGYSLQELMPITLQTWELLMHEDDVGAFLALQQNLRDGQQLFVECSVRLRHKQGNWKWFQVRTGVAQQDEYGKPVHLSGVTIDTTTAHEAEAALQKAYQYARSLLEASLDPLVTINNDGKITDLNEATVEATGVPREQMIGTDFAHYFTDAQQASAVYRQVFASGRVVDYPLVMRHTSCKLTDVLYNATLYRDAEEEIVGVVATARNVTEIKRVERQLRTSYAYARSLLEASLDPLVTINVEGKITDVNQATVSITGVERSALIGTDFCNYFVDPDQARQTYRLVFSRGNVSDYLLVMKHASGNTLDVLYNASVYLDEEGHAAGVFVAARDVSLLRQSQLVLERINHDVMLLSEMSNLLQSCTSVDESFPIIVATLQKLFPQSSGRCFMMKASGDQMVEMEGWGQPLPVVPTTSPCDCWALRMGHAHEYGLDQSINPPCKLLGMELKPYMCVPLVAQGQSLGVIHLLLPANDVGDESLRRTRRLVRAAADSIGLALANLRLRESLHAMSVRDPLTGLYNRRFMEDSLSREISRMARANKPMAVAMLDLDHFKQFNDQYGHDAGDLVLKEFARLMQGFREGSDVACRFGGEEFLLVLPEVTHDQAAMRLNALRESVSKQVVKYAGRALPAITVSIGFAMYPDHGRNLEDLMKQADRALYRAKGSGRNRVVPAEEVPSAEPGQECSASTNPAPGEDIPHL
ncbi:diguanylate cyclase [Candidatus Symbiobacter mobilis]|uniref:diguanylate cyclase n=1 Tax=Candidatus Symbiobacter mobilis CR TaxID=946483 RepID=U5N604_9BURK|nr:diguanylate cyclase [Candidatus Symbiobacter mobilis]AGX86797.1 kinase-like protein [Candidatus Symbiobacter mobilis CR]